MLVSDILLECGEIIGYLNAGPKGPLFFKKLTRAIQCLANKGNWDALQLYMDINVQKGQHIVILPREVFSPISFTINKNPSFSRDRLYEFSLSGPGQQKALYDWQWMEMNSVPLLADLPSVGNIITINSAVGDTGKTIQFFGLDNQQNEISETITLNGGTQLTINSYAVMRRIQKALTTQRVQLFDASGNALSNFYPDELNPRYRKIKLPKRATQIHLLFKRTTLEVFTTADYIPLDSEDAVLNMLRANEMANNNQGATADEIKKFEDRALKLLQEEQTARNAYAPIAQANQIQPGFNLNINNRDSLIAADVIDDVFDVLGPIGKQKAFDRITDVLEMLQNKFPNYRPLEGSVDLAVGHGGEVTFPRYVYRALMISQGCSPLQIRNRWFEFHLNGPGSQCRTPHGFCDDLPDTVTAFDPRKPFRLVAINDSGDDEGATIHVYGYDDTGKRVISPNPDLDDDNLTIDGYIYTASYANTLPDPQTPVWSKIDRITREQTEFFQQLQAYEIDGDSEPILVGYYYPDETEPKYARMRVPWRCPWIRMLYRKREIKITSLTDPLNLRSRWAIREMLESMKAATDPKMADPNKAKALEASALQHMTEQYYADNPSERFEIEVDPHLDFAPRTECM